MSILSSLSITLHTYPTPHYINCTCLTVHGRGSIASLHTVSLHTHTHMIEILVPCFTSQHVGHFVVHVVLNIAKNRRGRAMIIIAVRYHSQHLQQHHMTATHQGMVAVSLYSKGTVGPHTQPHYTTISAEIYTHVHAGASDCKIIRTYVHAGASDCKIIRMYMQVLPIAKSHERTCTLQQKWVVKCTYVHVSVWSSWTLLYVHRCTCSCPVTVMMGAYPSKAVM